jgi:hypothetical protein
MNIKRSYLQALLGSVTVGLFLANCTVQQAKDDGSCDKGDKHSGCDCDDGSVGYQVCDSDGVFGSCVCPSGNTSGGSSNNGTAGKANNSTGGDDTTSTTGGKGSGTAGTTYTGGDGGTPTVDPAAGGAAGGGPLFVPEDPNDCSECLDVLCKDDFDTCLADDVCGDQYLSIIGCIENVRETMLAKRDVVRGCGVNVGSSPNASLQAVWGDPQTLDPKTTNLLNCMATSASETPSAAWANDKDTNFPNDVPAPWPADSCAKFSCTAKFQ